MTCCATVTLVGLSKRNITLAPDLVKWVAFRIPADAISVYSKVSLGHLFEFRFSSDKVVDFKIFTNGADLRVASIGVVGFMICPANDTESRLNFMEAVTFDDLRPASVGSADF